MNSTEMIGNRNGEQWREQIGEGGGGGDGKAETLSVSGDDSILLSCSTVAHLSSLSFFDTWLHAPPT